MYPRWVQRAPHIGHVLCHSAEEEAQLLGDYAAEQKAAAKETEAAERAAKEAADAEAIARAEAIKAEQKAAKSK
jgi:hypothetical protein